MFFWNSLAFSMIQQMLAILALVKQISYLQIINLGEIKVRTLKSTGMLNIPYQIVYFPGMVPRSAEQYKPFISIVRIYMLIYTFTCLIFYRHEGRGHVSFVRHFIFCTLHTTCHLENSNKYLVNERMNEPILE